MEERPELHFCVLIPCYNNPEGLLRSLRSIRYPAAQHLVVVVDDGSTVPVTPDLLKGVACPVHILRMAQNSGITEALNTGLKWIESHLSVKYIARLDCSDTCSEDRFYRQVAFLDAHPEVGLLGSWCVFEKEDGSARYTYTTPLHHEAIVREMHLRNVFIHPTVMFRIALLRRVGVYPCEFPHAEDYALFWKMIRAGRSAILDRYLVTCALNPAGLSMGNRKKQLVSRRRVVARMGNNVWLKLLSFIKIQILLFVPVKLIVVMKAAKT